MSKSTRNTSPTSDEQIYLETSFLNVRKYAFIADTLRHGIGRNQAVFLVSVFAGLISRSIEIVAYSIQTRRRTWKPLKRLVGWFMP